MKPENVWLLAMGIGLAVFWPSVFAWASTDNRRWLHAAAISALLVTAGWVCIALFGRV